MAAHAAWYSGSDEKLQKVYAGGTQAPIDEVDKSRPGLFNRFRNYFWGRNATPDDLSNARLSMHVPVPGDICATSADLLAGEPWTFEIPETETDEPPDPEDQGAKARDTDRNRAQDRLEEIVEEGGISNVLLEACELASALGGVYFRPAWDREIVPDRPLLTLVEADRAVPEFRYGILSAVTFWRELDTDDTKVIRQLERHEPGVILHGLYEGTKEVIGRRIDLGAHPETKALAEEITNDGNEVTVDGWDRLFVSYFPNINPNRRHRGYQGRGDLQGIEHLLDGIDETWTSWMRDIRLGKARILVARDFLEGGGQFNIDREVFSPLEMDAYSKEGASAITDIQFTIRTEEHYNTAMALRDEAVSTAGYSPSSFRPMDEGPESGNARRMRERKSISTTSKKERYIRPALSDALELMLFLDRAIFGNKTPTVRPRCTPSDTFGEGQGERAEAINTLRMAKAISIKTGVEMAHPDWDEKRVDAEVALILEEERLDVPALLPLPEGDEE